MRFLIRNEDIFRMITKRQTYG